MNFDSEPGLLTISYILSISDSIFLWNIFKVIKTDAVLRLSLKDANFSVTFSVICCNDATED